MKRHYTGILILFLLFNLAFTAMGQSTIGLTGKPDSGYTTQKAYANDKKDHPEIEIVNEFNYDAVAQKKGIVYCEVGKRKLLTDVFYPKEKKNGRTAIIIIHGGGWRTGNRTQHYPLAEALANKGYVCFTPEYRLSTEALFPAGVYDVKAAIRWVRANAAQYGIDTSKVVALGFSAGGELAAFMGTTGNMPLFEGTDCNTTFASNVNAVVDIDGTLSFVHPESGEGDDSKSISAGTYWFGYSKKDNYGVWVAASPLSYVSAKTPPTLFINSSVSRMHAGREDYRKVLDEHHIYSEVHTFETAPHSFCLYHPWFNPTVDYINEFLQKVFPN